MIEKVPTSDTGTAASGMIAARQVCRKMMTTMTTSRMASRKRMHDGFNRVPHENRRVIHDVE